MQKGPANRGRRGRVVAAVIVAALALVLPAGWVEVAYSRGLFPWIQTVLVPVTGWLPLPLMGTLLLAAPVALSWFAVRRWRRGRVAGVTRGALLRAGGLRALRWALYVYAAFVLLWGLGYRRVPIEQRWQLGDEPLTVEQVRDVQMRLLAVLHRDGAVVEGADEGSAWRAIVAAERALVQEREGWSPATPAHLKHPPSGWLMAMGIYGVVSPFTLEANVDPALPTPMRLAIGGHELAHLFGYCGEADANLVSFVAGLRAEDAFARYGTALSLARYAMATRQMGDALRFRRLMPQRARDDLAALRDARERHESRTLSKVTSAVNDGYLKTQGVKLGTDDYARGFQLFVRAFDKGLVPLPEPFVPEKK